MNCNQHADFIWLQTDVRGFTFHFQLQLWICPVFQESCLFTGYIRLNGFYSVLIPSGALVALQYVISSLTCRTVLLDLQDTAKHLYQVCNAL